MSEIITSRYPDNIRRRIKQYTTNGIILDTKPLILFLVGIYDKTQLGINKLAREFSEEDFRLIMIFINLARGKVITTPHILSEASNFIKRDFTGFQDFFNKIKINLGEAKEICIEKEKIIINDEFSRFGITDIGIILTQQKYGGLILTTNSDLEREFAKEGVQIINFNHIRAMNWKKQNNI